MKCSAAIGYDGFNGCCFDALGLVDVSGKRCNTLGALTNGERSGYIGIAVNEPIQLFNKLFFEHESEQRRRIYLQVVVRAHFRRVLDFRPVNAAAREHLLDHRHAPRRKAINLASRDFLHVNSMKRLVFR